MKDAFVHLEVKSAFSYQFDSLVKLAELISKTKEYGMNAVAITDENVLFSAVDFYTISKENGIKPIIGLTVNIKNPSDNTLTKVVMLAKNKVGYNNIVKFSSFVNIRKTNDKFITMEEFEKNADNLVVMVNLENVFTYENSLKALDAVNWFSATVPSDDLYFICGKTANNRLNQFLLTQHKEKQIKLVATNSVHYIEEKDEDIKVMKEAIQGVKSKDVARKGQYFKTQDQMIKQYANLPGATSNTIEIAEKCNLVLELKGEVGFRKKLPPFPVPQDFVENTDKFGGYEVLIESKESATAYERKAMFYLLEVAFKGLNQRYGKNPQAEKRLLYELKVIFDKDFTNYFLIVQDFMKYALENDIPLGPGRGSAAGSILAFCLNITDVCPLKYDLMFERFLNPERTDDPDIDLDISQEKRHLMFSYAQEKYGFSKVAKVISFNNYGGKSAVKDLGKLLNIQENIVEQLTKNITKKVSDLAKHRPMVHSLITQNPDVKKLIDYAVRLEGLPKNQSTHAAGIVLSDKKLYEEVPVLLNHDKELGSDILVVQLHKEILETVGFTKVDFLALRNLDVIHNVKKVVLETKGIDLKEIPFDDPKTFEVYQQGQTLGVFQMDSNKMRETAEKVKPQKLEEIFPLIALYRPGAMDMIPMFVKNKQDGKNQIYDLNVVFDEKKDREVMEFAPFEADVSLLAPILEKTYGVIVYQEQIMQIAQKWAGYTLGEADLFRRAISKKKMEILEQQENIFVSRSTKQGRDKVTSERLFALIVKFSNYGFNIPHSAAYSIISYTTAYLKVNYPKEYMGALISSQMFDKSDKNNKKTALYIEEARKLGIHIAKPDINNSNFSFDVTKDGLNFGLALAKNVGKKAALSIVEERSNGLFTSFNDFLNRMRSKAVDKTCIESLIKIGAFDEFGNRKQLVEAMNGGKTRSVIFDNQILFADIPGIGSDDIVVTQDVEDYTFEEKIDMEMKLLGIISTEVPAQRYQEQLKSIIVSKHKLSDFNAMWLGGSVISKKEILDKNKKPMAFLKLTNGSKEYDVTVFNDKWENLKSDLVMSQIYLFKVVESKGKYSVKEYEQLSERKQMSIVLDRAFLKDIDSTRKLASAIKENPGIDELLLRVGKEEKSYAINLTKEFLGKMQSLNIKKESIKFQKVRYE